MKRLNTDISNKEVLKSAVKYFRTPFLPSFAGFLQNHLTRIASRHYLFQIHLVLFQCF